MIQGTESLTVTTIRADALDVPAVLVRVVDPAGAPHQLELGLAPLVIGTDPTCDIVLDDPGVSRRHCELRFGPNGILLRDLASKNGLLIYGVRALSVVLPVGVEVNLGGSALMLYLSDGKRTVPLSRGVRFGAALGASVRMRALFSTLERAAAIDETVLILGESGTGKELLARGVHDQSTRCHGPFVVFDCSATAPGLIESELFGHVKGAFTGAASERAGVFEQAQGGTLFLDEVGELPLTLQPKLLRALEARSVKPVGGSDWTAIDCRVVAATHRDLRAQVARGEFRQDLYYRIAVLSVDVPPLRERKEDIPLLVENLLQQASPGWSLDDVPPAALKMLQNHDWPGNVRELRNAIARFVALRGTDDIIGDDVTLQPSGDATLRLPWAEAKSAAREAFERRYVQARLREHRGNVSHTAAAMQVTRQFVHRLMSRHGITRDNL